MPQVVLRSDRGGAHEVTSPQLDGTLDRSTGSLAHEEVLRAYSPVAEAAGRGVELHDLLVAVTRQARLLLGVRRCALYLREGVRFCGAAAVIEGDREDPAIERLVCGMESDGFTREILASGEPVLVKDAVHDPRPVRAAVVRWQVRAILGVPLMANGEVVGLLFLDDAGGYHKFRPGDEAAAAMFASLAGGVVAQALRLESLGTAAAKAEQQNQKLRRLNVLAKRLTDLAVGAKTLQETMDVIVSVLGEPCVLHDADLQRLAWSGPGAERPDVLDGDRGSDTVRAVLEAVTSGEPACVGPFLSQGVNRRYLIAPVSDGRELFGYLVASERTRRLCAQDLRVASHAASVLALRADAGAVQEYARQGLLRELLGGRAQTLGLACKAERFGFDLKRPHVVALLQGEPSLELDEVERAIRAAGLAGTAFAASGDAGRITLVLQTGPSLASRVVCQTEARTAVERVISQLPAGDLKAALSSTCELPAEGPAAMAEAEQVLSCVLAVGRDKGVVVLSADEVGVALLMLTALDQTSATRFVRRTLSPLLDGDARNAELLGTLGVFFDCCRSVRRAALALNVHENTIRYRVARVEELTGLDLVSNPDHQLSGQLAVLILRLQGDVPSLPIRHQQELALALSA